MLNEYQTLQVQNGQIERLLGNGLAKPTDKLGKELFKACVFLGPDLAQFWENVF